LPKIIFLNDKNDLIDYRKKQIQKICIIQKHIRKHLFRKEQSKFLTNCKRKCIDLLKKFGAEFFDNEKTEAFLKQNKFNLSNNKITLSFLRDDLLKKNIEVYHLVEKFSTNYLNKLDYLYNNLDMRYFKNIEQLPVYYDNQIELCFYSFFDLLKSCNLGHCIIFSNENKIGNNLIKNNSKIELILSKNTPKEAHGIIHFSHGDFYIGKLELDKIKFFNFEEIEPVSLLNEKIYDNIKSVNTQIDLNNNDVRTYRPNEKTGIKYHGILENEIHLNNNPFKEIEMSSYKSHIEKIVDIKPSGEGIYIKETSKEVIHLKNFDLIDIFVNNGFCDSEAQKNKNNEVIQYQNHGSFKNTKYKDLKVNFLNFFKNERVIKYAVIYDYYNNTKYEGEALLKDNQFIKSGKGRLEFLDNKDYYDGFFQNNYFEGEGTLYEKNKGIFTQGNWIKGKLNGKGFITKENNSFKEKCIWRFGRLINKLKIVNKDVVLNEEILDFLNNDDLLNIVLIKNKIFYNYFTKNNKSKIKHLQESKNGLITKAKAGNNKYGLYKKNNNTDQNNYFNSDIETNKSENNNFFGKSLEKNTNGNGLTNYKSQNSNFFEDGKESDVYLDCISNEEYLNSIKDIKEDIITIKEEDSYENEIPYDEIHDEENRHFYKFINDKYKEIDVYLGKKWSLMEEKKDFKSFYFDEPSGLRSVKTEIIIRVELDKVRDFLMDLSQRHKYNKNLDVVKDIRQIGKNYYLKYLKLKSVLILSSRDFVLAEKIVVVK